MSSANPWTTSSTQATKAQPVRVTFQTNANQTSQPTPAAYRPKDILLQQQQTNTSSFGPPSQSQSQPPQLHTPIPYIRASSHPTSYFSTTSTPTQSAPPTPTLTSQTNPTNEVTAASTAFQLPTRSTARAQVLAAAASIGLHGWNQTPSPMAVSSDSTTPAAATLPANFLTSISPQFDMNASTSLADYHLWLTHARAIRDLLKQENAAHAHLMELDNTISAHEREADSRDVLSHEGMDAHAKAVWEWAQHLAALMSPNADTPVGLRNPQPSQWHLIARANDATQQQQRERQFTAAPVAVHPSLRSLLQPPIARNSFIHVEPELQPGLMAGVESMCRDVAEWKSPRAAPSEALSSGLSSPPDALAWTSTLQKQQQPLSSVLESVVSNWSRLQRVADGVSNSHQITRELYDRERATERRILEIVEQEKRIRRVDRGQIKQQPIVY